jgi:hypothetical protein
MSRFGFCGAAYQSQSLNADAQVCRNWYPEVIESQEGKSSIALYPTPGLKLAYTLSGPSVRGEFTINGRVFAVSGTNFYELFPNGAKTIWGAVANDNFMVSMAASAQQLLLASAGTAYVFNLASNAFTTIPAGTLNSVLLVGYTDGFFIALFNNSARIQVSTLLDATSWPGGNAAVVSVFADNVISMLLDHRELWLFGAKNTVVYYDSGNVFPYDVVNGGFIEQGCIAQFSPVRIDNTVMWLGGDERGAGIVWRAQGYTPTRVSNHAIEFAMQGYPTISDAISYAYQDQGHSFYVLYFPTANKTWVCDVEMPPGKGWHERSYFNNGLDEAHHSQCHVFAFGKHLVGDWSSGNVYQMAINLYDDAGQPIRRVRRAPHIAKEFEWQFHEQLIVDLETGLGNQTGQGLDPQLNLRWSNDAGHTWSNSYTVSAGKAGAFQTRAKWNRLGRARSRVYEISVTDPIAWRIVDAYLKASPDYAPSERMADQLRKVG